MKKFYIVLTLVVCIAGIFSISASASDAENKGVLILDIAPDILTIQTDVPEFQPMHITVVKILNETEVTLWEADITEQEDISIPVSTGKYKLYVQLHGHRTIWEIDDEGRGYEVLSSSSTVVPTWANTPCKDVIADAPWRVQSDKIPILIMVKDADAICGDYDLGDVEIYLDGDCDKDNNEADDTLLETETKWHGVIVDESFYNLYYPGDWYGITYLDPSEHGLTGDVCLHVVIRDVGGLIDLDRDAHSHFNVTIATDTLPTLTNWHPGDTHYHSSYTDNAVEFGFPVNATVEAGKAIGLDWNAITDHSFDVRDSKTADPNHKWNALKNDITTYTTDSYKLILGEEVSCYGHEITLAIVPPSRGVVHFLVLGMENFVDVIGTGVDFIPGQFDEDLVDTDGQTLNLEDVIDIVNSQGGVCYAAHPEAHRGMDAWLLGRVPWITEDYDLTGYNGLQVWNEKYAQDDDWEIQRDDGLKQWTRLLREKERKDVFIAGGSDAHGDFSHHTGGVWPVVEETDNAFGKVRTYVYTETFDNDGILNALKNGHSIMTDGPLVTFSITNEHGDAAIIGNEIAGNDLRLNIQWESTPEFGNVDHIYVHRGIIGETDEEDEIYHLTPNTLSGAELYSDLSEKIPSPSYIRIEATSSVGGEIYRCYTNPIWVIPLSSGRSGGPDDFGYTFIDSNAPEGPTYDWIEISGTGTEVLPDSDDSWVEDIGLGFFFNYYGTDYSQLAISNNGLLFSGGTTRQYVNEPITQTPGIHGFVAPFWDDLVTWGAGTIYYQTLGTAPNRMFVVEWYDNKHYSNSDSGVTFEAILYEGSNNILFQYKDVEFGNVYGAVSGDNPPYDNGGSATVGIEGPAGDDGIQYSFNEQIIDPGLAILFKFPQFAGTNLYLSKQAPASKDHGSAMTYTLHYHNFGDTPAQNVVLEDTLPAEVEFISASDSGSYDSNTRKVKWNIGSVTPSGHGYETVSVRIPQGVQIGTVIQNDASISTSNLEVRYDDNEAHARTTVTGSSLPPDVGVEPNNGGTGIPSIYWHDPITFSYHSCEDATGVDIRIHVNDGGPDIIGSMAGGPPDWTYTTTFYPRHGRATITYTIHGCDVETVTFDIYIDPAGYIYDTDTGERIAGATVWLLWSDGEGGWVNVPTGEVPPISQPDENPLITGADGQYQWDVLAGSYRVHVEAAGYYPADSIVVGIPPAVTDLHVGLTRIPSENEPPVATDDGVTTLEDAAVTINVTANDNDVDGNIDPTTANTVCNVCSGPTSGTLTNPNNGTFAYTPDPDYNGPDSFIYEICDTEGLCDTATVTIDVTAVNDAPVISVDVTEQTVQYSDGIANITISATDVDSS
ncbi:MAG TPA: CehA/McbA family metallohydrolase, partial [Methanosarcinales archaeon]|nr:CehA/McbA family metallohydrolase [Methanosarcinales archaeon]